ncbi:MAG: toxin-antitoxin system HicB family antitoxin [Burkholderiales bacterium]|nr:toxin-antitoxin system HicB family antitoxin [Burkholderiales bacterium]
MEFCKERGEEPDKPFSGKLVLRMEPKLHRG